LYRNAPAKGSPAFGAAAFAGDGTNETPPAATRAPAPAAANRDRLESEMSEMVMNGLPARPKKEVLEDPAPRKLAGSLFKVFHTENF
jgi:hypothetical protein